MAGFLYQRVQNKQKTANDEHDRCYGEAPCFVGAWLVFFRDPKNENGYGHQTKKDPVGKHDIGDDIFESPPEEQQKNRPGRLQQDGIHRGSEPGVDFGEAFEKYPVIGHGIIKAR